MQFSEERPSTDVVMDIDMTDEEFELLLNHAKKHMPEEELNKVMVEWSILDAIKHYIDTHEETDEEN